MSSPHINGSKKMKPGVSDKLAAQHIISQLGAVAHLPDKIVRERAAILMLQYRVACQGAAAQSVTEMSQLVDAASGIIAAARELMVFIGANTGPTDDWSVRMSADNTPDAEKLAKLLTNLQTALGGKEALSS